MDFSWFRRRHKRYGWATQTGDYQAKQVPLTLWERATESNRLWLVCVAALVITVAMMTRIPERLGIKFPSAPAIMPAQMSSIDDELHRSYLTDLNRTAAYESVVDAAFDGPQDLRIVLSGPVTDDDVYYISKLAAYKANKDLGVPCTVRAYLRRATQQDTLLATTTWLPEKYGYVVDFNRPTDL